MSSARVAKGYDRLAGLYDGMARLVYGNALRKAQTSMLARLPKDATVLVLGGGSGWFLEQLMRGAQPQAVIYVDLSSKMLALSRQRIHKYLPDQLSKISFVQRPAEDAPQWANVDVVVTHCLLDMFVDASLLTLVAQLRTCLQPNGQWYFSDFAKVQSGPMAIVSRAMIWMMYRFFRFTCKIEATDLPDFVAAFANNGLVQIEEERFYGGMITAARYRKDI